MHDPVLDGFKVCGRKDRAHGGVVCFSNESIGDSVTLLEVSPDDDRVWLLVPNDLGPVVICSWYRPPHPGEIASIARFEDEWQRYRVLGLVPW